MPATKFICPNEEKVDIEECLRKCKQGRRCMFLPTLRAIAKSLDRKIRQPSVTELIAGVRETYLKKVTEYAVDPFSVLYSLQGQAIHTIHEKNAEGILSEVRLEDGITSGRLDLYGNLLDEEEGILGDLKVTNSYKLMKALGIYKVEVETGEVYKTGLKKGQAKTRKEFRYDGVREILDWAIQLNYYRRLLEKEGYPVRRMVIQALCRDSNLKTAVERGITEKSYLIEINKISDYWLQKYFSKKATMLREAMETRELPPICTPRERWNDRKCLDYCAARENCPYARRLIAEKENNAESVSNSESQAG